MTKTIEELNPDCWMCNGNRDVCYYTLKDPCPMKGKKKGKGYHECKMLGYCSRCELVKEAYDLAASNQNRISTSTLVRAFRLGFSGAEKLCLQLQDNGIKIV